MEVYDCKGCNLKCESEPYEDENTKCPCMTCLVKVTCTVICQEWKIYWNKSIDAFIKRKNKNKKHFSSKIYRGQLLVSKGYYFTYRKGD